MFHYSKYRSQSVITTSIYQNDCSIGGVCINVLDNKLYYLENNALYVVDWTLSYEKPPKMIYQSNANLRDLHVNHEFIGFIEEGSGLVLLETALETEFCKIGSINDHFTFYSDLVLYNVGQKVYTKELVGREIATYVLTAPEPITQLIEDEDWIIIQMKDSNFKKALKLVFDKDSEWEDMKNPNWRIKSRKGLNFYTHQHLQNSDSKQLGTHFRQLKTEALCHYLHEGNLIICYEKDGHYLIVLERDVNVVYAILEDQPDWFAYLGDLIVYSSHNKIQFLQVAEGNHYASALEEMELIKERRKEIQKKFSSIETDFSTPLIDTLSPAHLMEFMIITEENVQYALNSPFKPHIKAKNIHLDILTGHNISLLTIDKLIQKLESDYPHTEFQWKVNRTFAIKEDSLIVFCTEINSELIC